MYKNYFLFEKQVNEIKPLLLGRSIEKIFTYQKNEMVIELFEPDSLFLLINVSAHLPYLLLRSAHNIKQHKYQLFQEIQNSVICDLNIKLFDKQVIISFENYKMIAIFYGSQPNVFLLDSNNSIVNSFKTGTMPGVLTSENLMDLRIIDRKIFDLHNSNSLDTLLKNKFAAMNNTIINEIVFRYNQAVNLEKIDYSKLSEVLKAIANEMEESVIYLYKTDDSLNKISLFRLYHLEINKEYSFRKYDTLNEAWQRFISEKAERTEFKKLHKLCMTSIDKKLDYLQRSFKHAEDFKNLKERKELAELKGNLLLTFKNQIKLGKSEVILENIFSDNLEKVCIKLNPNKSVSENAQIYFNKYKDLDKKRIVQNVKANTLKKELSMVKELNDKLDTVKTLTDLKKISEKLADLNILVFNKSTASIFSKYRTTFKQLILYNDWHVYIGKSGESNDELTFKFANKWDYWFHAQGASGSHVILKVKQKSQVPPYHVLEQVASIAAANSKAKHSTTVPVIYTRVRYVSRIRNAAKGTVSTRNEKTLFVEPLQIS